MGIHGSRFLNRWTAQPSTDFVVLNIDINLAVEPDYSYLDPIVNLIKPLAMEVVRKRPGSGNNHDIERLQMLERDAFLNNLQTIRVVVSTLADNDTLRISCHFLPLHDGCLDMV